VIQLEILPGLVATKNVQFDWHLPHVITEGAQAKGRDSKKKTE
jgi:hypothetical protein